MSLMEILAAAREQQKPDGPRPLPEAQIMTMREIFAAYRQPRFKPGDVITPCRWSHIKNVGEPHLVLEVLPDPEPNFHGSEGSCMFGCRDDIRFVALQGTQYAAFWGESWCFEFYAAVATTEPMDLRE